MASALSVTTRSPEETRIVGSALGAQLRPADVVSLAGELGSGKTTFVQGVAGGLGVARRVTSPTFTIVHEYQGRHRIVHVDVYRLESIQEVLDLGFEDLLDTDAIVVVEWGQAVAALLPPGHLEVRIRRPPDPGDDSLRIVSFQPHAAAWTHKLDAMRTTAEAVLDATSPGASSEQRFD